MCALPSYNQKYGPMKSAAPRVKRVAGRDPDADHDYQFVTPVTWTYLNGYKELYQMKVVDEDGNRPVAQAKPLSASVSASAVQPRPSAPPASQVVGTSSAPVAPVAAPAVVRGSRPPATNPSSVQSRPLGPAPVPVPVPPRQGSVAETARAANQAP
jgi:hypothetical protein